MCIDYSAPAGRGELAEGELEPEPWLSVLSELSGLSEHCRSTVGALSEVTVGPVGAFLTVTTCSHCHALSELSELSVCRSVGLSGLSVCRTILSDTVETVV